MGRSNLLLWLVLIIILILPGAAGRFFIDLAGGLLLLFFLTPPILAVIGWLGWRTIRSKLIECPNCGTTSFSSSSNKCPICGYNQEINNKNQDSNLASSVTIDITPESAEIDSQDKKLI